MGTKIWKSKDLGKQVTDKVKVDWLAEFKGYYLELDIDVTPPSDKKEKERWETEKGKGLKNVLLVQLMVAEAQKIEDNVVEAIVDTVKIIDKKTKGKTLEEIDKERQTLKSMVNNVVKAQQGVIKNLPDQIIAKDKALKEQYKKYKINAGVQITLGVLNVAVSTAGAVFSSGATLAVSIVGIVRGIAAITKQTYDLALEAETVAKDLKTDLETLIERYKDPKFQGAKETGISALKAALGTDPPFIASLPKCNNNYKLLDNKVAGLYTQASKLGTEIPKAMDKIEKLTKELNNIKSEVSKKALKSVEKLEANLNVMLTNCSDLMKRVTTTQDNMKNFKKALDDLNSSNPKYAEIFDKVFPVIANLAIAGAAGGLGIQNVSEVARDMSLSIIPMALTAADEIRNQIA